jgi:hypothetical protein
MCENIATVCLLNCGQLLLRGRLVPTAPPSQDARQMPTLGKGLNTGK